jgi:hypothetical protein
MSDLIEVYAGGVKVGFILSATITEQREMEELRDGQYRLLDLLPGRTQISITAPELVIYRAHFENIFEAMNTKFDLKFVDEAFTTFVGDAYVSEYSYYSAYDDSTWHIHLPEMRASYIMTVPSSPCVPKTALPCPQCGETH